MTNPLRTWFVKWHGEGDEHQHDFYRCESCKRLVTWRIITTAGKCRCGCNKYRPSNPTIFEAFKVMVLPWLVK